MNLEEWKQLRRRAWENDYDYLQMDRFAKIGKGMYTIRNCNKTIYTECTPETKPFGKLKALIHIRLYQNTLSLNNHIHIFSKTITFTIF